MSEWGGSVNHMTSPFGNDPFDKDPFKDPFFKQDPFAGRDIDKTANRVIKGVGCFAVVYVLGFVLLFAGLIALVWKLVFA